MSDSILEKVREYQNIECEKIMKYIFENFTPEEIKEMLECFLPTKDDEDYVGIK